MNRPAVERFVRETLGCGCPEEVFRDLRFEPADGLHDGAVLVGGRLLIFLLRGQSACSLPALVEAGRRRRDAQGYNRVRFVLLAEDPRVVGDAERLFKDCANRDERTHLHVVPPDLLSSLGIL